MRYTEIAKAEPFSGAPKIILPDCYGASPKKPFLLRISAIGERPMRYFAEDLPKGLEIRDNIISGAVSDAGDYPVRIICENRLGRCETVVTFEIGEGKLQLTPLMGFTSWNAFGFEVTQADMEKVAAKMLELGISEYGYSFINIDSGWQGKYGGKYDAIMPNEKFPDMKGFCDRMHSLGYKCGIYSTPMLNAFGCSMSHVPLPPGCTQGEPDDRFADERGGIGRIRKEKNNALQWAEWGFDYLKYDWRPTDPINAELMRCELQKTNRDFGFCVSVKARPEYHTYWEKYCTSYRCNVDSQGNWTSLMEIYQSYFDFIDYINRGHYFDLDMLDTGECYLMKVAEYDLAPDFGLSEDEQILAYTLRAVLASPIQLSASLEKLSDFDMAMYCNEEIIAVNMDSAAYPAIPYMMVEDASCGKKLHVLKRRMRDGSYVYCVLNLGKTVESVKLWFDQKSTVRDLWAKRNVAESNNLKFTIYPHTTRVFRVTGVEKS